MSRIACLLLAAGESRRMGAVNKLLLSVEGKSLIQKTAEELLKYPFQEIVAVTGHEDQLIRKEILSERIHVVHNSNYQTGMHSSIRTGLLALSDQVDGFMVCLSDQPFLNVELIEKLAAQFSNLDGPRIVFPAVGGQKGHPVFISKHFISEILSEADGDYGCSYLFKRHPESLYPVAVDDSSALIDVDTPVQYQELISGKL